MGRIIFLFSIIAFSGLTIGSSAYSAAGRNPIEVRRMRGTAFTEGDRVLYQEETEIQFVSGKPTHGESRFFDSSGKLIAEMESSFGNNPYLPDYRVTDLRTKQWHSLKSLSNEVILTRFLGSSLESKRVSREENSVAGPGAVFFAKDNFNRLVQGEEFDVNFISPALLDDFSFQMLKSEEGDPSQVSFKMRIASWFLRLFAPTVTFTFAKEKNNLVRYTGPSLISDSSGKNPNVSVDYVF